MRAVRNPLPQLIPQRVDRVKADVDAMRWERTRTLDVRGGPINDAPIPLREGTRQRLTAVQPGEQFGPPRGGWHQRWFRVQVPAAGRDERGRRFLQWDCQGETTAYLNGEPWAGLDPAHPTCPLPDRAATMWLDCSTWQTGVWLPGTPPAQQLIGRYGLRFDRCALRIRDESAWRVGWDLDVLWQLMNVLLERDHVRSTSGFGYVKPLESCSPLLRLLLRGLDDACDAWVDGGLSALGNALASLMRRLPSWRSGVGARWRRSGQQIRHARRATG